MPPNPGRGRAPQRRNEQARLAVLHAADDLLAERGFAGVTIEGIAARAGVSKRAMLARGVTSGELPADLDIDQALDALTGPLFYRAMVSGGPISPAFTDQLVRDVLG